MSEAALNIIDKLYIPQRSIIKEYNRFKIYLPMEYNKIWQLLNEKRKKVDIIIVIK